MFYSKEMMMTYQVDQFNDDHVYVGDDQGEKRLALLLPQLSKRLDLGLRRIEHGFETLGNTLHAVHEICEKLTKGIKSSVNRIHVDSKESLLHDAGTVVEDSLAVLSRCRASISGSLDHIAGCAGDMARLSLVCQNMKKNSDVLHILGLNIRVESGRTSAASAMFEGFGDEIRALAAKLGETTTSIQSNAQKVQDNQAAMQSRISQSMVSFDLLAASTKKNGGPCQ